MVGSYFLRSEKCLVPYAERSAEDGTERERARKDGREETREPRKHDRKRRIGRQAVAITPRQSPRPSSSVRLHPLFRTVCGSSPLCAPTQISVSFWFVFSSVLPVYPSLPWTTNLRSVRRVSKHQRLLKRRQ